MYLRFLFWLRRRSSSCSPATKLPPAQPPRACGSSRGFLSWPSSSKYVSTLPARRRGSLVRARGGLFQNQFERLFLSVSACRIILPSSVLFCRSCALWELQVTLLFAPDRGHWLNPCRPQRRQKRSRAGNHDQGSHRPGQNPGITWRRSIKKACQSPRCEKCGHQTCSGAQGGNPRILAKDHRHHP